MPWSADRKAGKLSSITLQGQAVGLPHFCQRAAAVHELCKPGRQDRPLSSMPRPVRVFQQQVNKPVVLKLFTAAAVLAACLLAVTHVLSSDSKQLSAASYADAQISKLDVKSSDSTLDTASEPKAQPKEPTTSDIFHAVDAKLVSDSNESDAAEPLNTNEVFRQAELAKEVARQAAVDAEQLLISRQAEPVADVVYFNDAKTMAEIGCPAINVTEVTDNFTCFYQNPSAEAVEFLPSTWAADDTTSCAAVFRPLPADFGRPWCLQKSEVIDTRVGSSLEQTTILENTVWNRMSIEPRASGNGIKCWDRTQQ
ncbi:hypothetical protein WJX77_005591 [Trebouxia sp. C0004]